MQRCCGVKSWSFCYILKNCPLKIVLTCSVLPISNLKSLTHLFGHLLYNKNSLVTHIYIVFLITLYIFITKTVISYIWYNHNKKIVLFRSSICQFLNKKIFRTIISHKKAINDYWTLFKLNKIYSNLSWMNYTMLTVF